MLERLALSASLLPPVDRTRLLFALGKVRDDVGHAAAAFAAFTEGNRLHRQSIRHDKARAERLCQAIAQGFDHTFIEARRGLGYLDQLPIFILGMPRSGTTLVEQILASHPSIYGAGELTDLHQCINAETGNRDFARMDDWLGDLQAATWRRIGRAYIEKLRALAPDAVRVTDKMPGNHHLIGWIRLTLPSAKIVHVMRDPLDSCWSNYTHLFTQTMEFAAGDLPPSNRSSCYESGWRDEGGYRCRTRSIQPKRSLASPPSSGSDRASLIAFPLASTDQAIRASLLASADCRHVFVRASIKII